MYLASHTQDIYITFPLSSTPKMPVDVPSTSTTPVMQMHPPPMPGPPGPQGLPGAPGTSTETLEQRIYDLLAPFRGLDMEGDGEEFELPSRKDEVKALILCGEYKVFQRSTMPG